MTEHRDSSDVTVRLFRRRSSVPRARRLARSVLTDWTIDPDVTDRAELVISELVTNAIRVRVPGDRLVEMRLVRPHADQRLLLEVSDAGPGKPLVRVPDEDEPNGRGLLLVEALADYWGCAPRDGGIGKTVWAVIIVPGEPPRPPATDMTAVRVQPGQRVRTADGWHTVRTVRSTRYAAQGPPIVLAFDDGTPPLRLHAGEQLTVRAGEDGRDAAMG
ncbi:ATP-binding protein [Streptomyces xiamenensis]|uniref:ATP-binding protein n=1 Tax=Streptomyces xiamenensis TaxID=408015 RepID=UPI0035D6A3F1